MIVAKLLRVPFVLEIRDVWPDPLVQLGLSSKPIIAVLTRIERMLYQRSVAIVALTDGIADRIQSKSIAKDKITVIPNASLHTERLNDEERAAKRVSLSWQQKKVVIWTGAHNPANGLDVVVEAAKLLSARTDILFAFVGTGTDKPRLLELAQGDQNIHFYDPVPKSELRSLLHAADIGILNSRRFDAFTGARPNKLFEYMAAGLPMVCAIPGEALSIVQEANAGLEAEWENPASIAAAITQLVDDEVMARQLGESGYAYVEENHSREDTAQNLAELLTRVVNGNTSRFKMQERV